MQRSEILKVLLLRKNPWQPKNRSRWIVRMHAHSYAEFGCGGHDFSNKPFQIAIGGNYRPAHSHSCSHCCQRQRIMKKVRTLTRVHQSIARNTSARSGKNAGLNQEEKDKFTWTSGDNLGVPANQMVGKSGTQTVPNGMPM